MTPQAQPHTWFPARERALPRQAAADTAASPRASYLFLLAFIALLYANTPKVMPALEVVRPAAVVGGCALLALLYETTSAGRKLDFAMPEGAILVSFLLAAALSCVEALWPRYAVGAVSDLAKMTLVYFFIVNTADSEKRLQGIMWVMCIGGLFPALGTLKNFHSGNMVEGRAAWLGIFANPNEVAYSLVILLPLAAYLFIESRWFARLCLLGISLIYLPAIYVTFSRGGLIGLGAVAVIFSWRKRNIWLQLALVVVVIAGMGFAASHWTRDQNFSGLNNDVSFQERIATSQAGIGMFLDHPLTGVGLGCSVIAWPLYAPQNVYSRGALVTHNTLIQVFGETGLLGGIPFVLLIAIGLIHARKLALHSEARNLGIAIEVAIWGLIVCGMSGGYVLTWFPYILLGLAAAARKIAQQSLAEDTQ